MVTLYSALKGLLQVTPKSDIRFYLNGIHVSESGTLTATDGRMMIIVDNVIEDAKECIIGCNALRNVMKLFTKQDELCIDFKDDHIEIYNTSEDATKYRVNYIDGNYPDTTRVTKQFNKTSHEVIGLDMKLLSNLTKSISVILDNKFNGAKFEPHGSMQGVKIHQDNVHAYLMPMRLD